MDSDACAVAGENAAMPSNEIYLGMQTGALDAAMTSSTSLISFRLEELAKALTTARAGSIWFMREAASYVQGRFRVSLWLDQQKAITHVGGEMEWFGAVEAKKDDQSVAPRLRRERSGGRRFSVRPHREMARIAEESAWKDFASKSAEAAALL